MSEIRILFVGDVVGRPGRRAVAELLPRLREELALDMVIANGENSAGGFGITTDTADELLAAGVDVITTGNHVWDQKTGWPALASYPGVVRPANYPEGAPGSGVCIHDLGEKGVVKVVNLMGRLFMNDLDCPFRWIDRHLEGAPPGGTLVVDMHAEATSEKQAMGWHLDGRASLVVGTHTHVATADARLLPRETAYVTDVGMVGGLDSIIGMEPGPIVGRFLSGLPVRFKVAEGRVVFNSVLARINGLSGRGVEIERVDRLVDPGA